MAEGHITEEIPELEWKDDYPPYITSKDGKIEFLWEKVQWHRDENKGLHGSLKTLEGQIDFLNEQMEEMRQSYEDRLQLADLMIAQYEAELRVFRMETAKTMVLESRRAEEQMLLQHVGEQVQLEAGTDG